MTGGGQRLPIVGLSATGGSLAKAIRQAWPAPLVIDVDSADELEAAMRLHAFDAAG